MTKERESLFQRAAQEQSPHFVTPASECICYPGMCPMGCEPACPYCFQVAVIEYGKDGLPVDWVGPLPEEFAYLRRPK